MKSLGPLSARIRSRAPKLPRVRGARACVAAALLASTFTACTVQGDPWYTTEADAGGARAAADGGPDTTESGFETIVRPILDANGCLGCHSAALALGGLDAESLDGLLAGGANGPAIVACEPDAGTLLDKMSAAPSFGGVMPPGGPVPSDDDREALRQWILEGADGSCGGGPGGGEGLSFADDVLPILTDEAHGCTSDYCHSAATQSAGLDLSTYAGVIAGGASQATNPTVVPCDPDGSALIDKSDGGTPSFGSPMPLGGEAFDAEELDVIRQWIAEGAGETYDPAACAD